MSGTQSHGIPEPSSRLATRLSLPGAIVVGAIAIFAWTSWRAWAPLTTVTVAPVIVRPVAAQTPGTRSATTTRGPIVQAPGWIEPSPFPTMVSALIPGVVRDMLVLEGDVITANQVVAVLIDDKETLALRRAQAEADIKSADHAVLADEFDRKTKLFASGVVSEGEVTRLGIRARGAAAAIVQATVSRDEAALALSRTQVRSPSAGVVMARLATPGSLVGMSSEDAAVVQIFDPKSLQVRVDVPLSDAGRLAAGQSATVQVDSLPGVTIAGRVIRLVQQADIAKNTVQVKVLLENPPQGLVPDMLARVRIQTGAQDDAAGATSPVSQRTEVLARSQSLTALTLDAQGSYAGLVFVVVGVRDGVGTVEAREVVAPTMSDDSGWVVVSDGLRPGDLTVLAGTPSLTEGQSVRIAEANQSQNGAHDGHR